jgi:hypothetical protein
MVSLSIPSDTSKVSGSEVAKPSDAAKSKPIAPSIHSIDGSLIY